jgi:hypothetical protein
MADRCKKDQRGTARTRRWHRDRGGTATLRGCPPRSGVPARTRLTVRDSVATRSAAPSSWISGHTGTCQCPGTQTDPGRAAAFRELAYSLAGGSLPEAWWRDSHERILSRGRALTWPARLADLETQACQIVGDEFYDRRHSPGTGLHPAQWLRALAEKTGAASRTALTRGADDWQKLWALLCGLALMAPRTPADAAEEAAREKFPEFPEIKDPLETALAEAERFAKLAAGREAPPGLGRLIDGWRLGGLPMVVVSDRLGAYPDALRAASLASRRGGAVAGPGSGSGSPCSGWRGRWMGGRALVG